MFNFANLAKTVIKAIQNSNDSNPNVKTVDKSVFEKMEKHAEEVEHEVNDTNHTRSRADVYKEMNRRMEEVRRENEMDQNVETADASVFDEMQRKIEELQKKIDQQAGSTPGGVATNAALAVVNSNGGSLELRMGPDMGADKHTMRVPHNATIKILERSDKSIFLDGKQSNFVYVDYNGTQGWLLDSYLH
jgi:hypothetical protein